MNEEFLASAPARAAGITAAVLERRLKLWSMPEVEAWARRYDSDSGRAVAMTMHAWLLALESCAGGFVPQWPVDEPLPEGCSILVFHAKGRIELARMPMPESLEGRLLDRWCEMTADQRIAWLIELGTALAAHVEAVRP